VTNATNQEMTAMNSSRRLDNSLFSLLCAMLLGVAASAQAEVLPASRPIAGSYIVVLNANAGSQAAGVPADTAALASDLSSLYGGRTTRSFRALKGFTFKGSALAADSLSRDPRVAYVAQDGVVTTSAVQTPSPSWGLDRIDQRDAELDTEYVYNNTGAGVDLYVVDTGIRSTHEDFAGRVDTVNAFTAIQDGHGTEDCFGHGTLVAGVAAGSTHGVAKGVTLHPVRVVGCDGLGATSDVIAGIEWITARQQGPNARRAVVNMSLNNGFSFPLEDAVNESIAAGVVYVAAAGNDGVEAACYLSPQRLPGVITVGASDEGEARWAGSNFGECLDIFAPGVGIVSTSALNDTASGRTTGTSIAAPHVAGTAVLALAANPDATPAEVQAMIAAAATTGELSDVGTGSPNLLLYSAFTGSNNIPQAIFGDDFESGDVSGWAEPDGFGEI
jgi:subtilisin family serine protease